MEAGRSGNILKTSACLSAGDRGHPGQSVSDDQAQAEQLCLGAEERTQPSSFTSICGKVGSSFPEHRRARVTPHRLRQRETGR